MLKKFPIRKLDHRPVQHGEPGNNSIFCFNYLFWGCIVMDTLVALP